MSDAQSDRPVFVPPLGRDLPCGSCHHSHSWLPCDWCLCDDVTQPGIY